MKPIVTNLIISTLKGESGSNPEIHTCFPNDSGIKRDKIINFTLPSGSRANDISESRYKGQDLIVFVSELNQEKTRNDIVTFGFLLNNHCEVKTVISIVKTIFSDFQIEKIKDIEEFTNLGIKLFQGLNTKKFSYNSYSFDIHGYLNTTGMSLVRELRKVQGGLF
jgi:hypothetical protein